MNINKEIIDLENRTVAKKGIYGIINTVNNRTYVGKHKRNIKNRCKEHIKNLNNKVRENIDILKDWEEFGNDKFIFVYIETFENDISNDELLMAETKWINFYGFPDQCKVYNKTNNIYYCDEYKKLLSENHANFCGDNHPKGMLGKKHSEETKKIMSESQKKSINKRNKGKKCSEETKKIKSELFKGDKNPQYGKFNFDYSVYKKILQLTIETNYNNSKISDIVSELFKIKVTPYLVCSIRTRRHPIIKNKLI